MTPQPFTPAGVTAMQAELNALSPSDLATQVSLIKSDLRSWVSANFNLTPDQATYLAAMGDQFFDYASGVTAFAVANDLTITLVPGGPPTTLKLIHVNDDIVVTNSSSGGITISGGVTYTVVYE